MAHVGKQYKLAFRRDLSQHFTNATGLPEAFDIVNTAFELPNGSLWPSTTFRCVNTAKLGQPPMTWLSGSTTNSLGIWTLTWIMDRTWEFPTSDITISVQSTTHFERFDGVGQWFHGEVPNNVDILTFTTSWTWTRPSGVITLPQSAWRAFGLFWADYP
jgi:hypothetical protein